MDSWISKFTKAFTHYSSMSNDELKNKGLRIRESRKCNSLFGDLTCFLDDLASIDKFSEEIVPNFNKFYNNFEFFLLKVYEDKLFLHVDFAFLEVLVITAYKIDNYYLKLKSLKILSIWLHNYSDSRNNAHPYFIVSLLNTSCNVSENIYLRRIALLVVTRLIKKNVKNKRIIIDKNELFDLKGIGESILTSDDFKVQELCSELIHELLPPRNSPMEYYDRRFDLFFSLNSLSDDLKNEFLNMQNSGWMYSPKWLISLNSERKCDSAPLTFECLYLKLEENAFYPICSDETLFVHVSKNFLYTVLDLKNERGLLDIALKDVDEILEFNNQIVLKLKEDVNNESVICDDFGFFNLVTFFFDTKSETKIIIQDIVKRIKRNMGMSANSKCSIIECPISLRVKNSNNVLSNDSFQHRTIVTNVKSSGFSTNELIQEKEFKDFVSLHTLEQCDIENDKKSPCSEFKEIGYESRDSYIPDNNRSGSDGCKNNKEKYLLRVSTQVQDLFSLVTLENEDKSAQKNAKVSEKMKKKLQGLKELTNVLPSLNEVSKLDKKNDSSIKKKNNNGKDFDNNDIYDFPLSDISYFYKSPTSEIRSKKKYMLKSNFSTLKKNKIENKLRKTCKGNSSSKGFFKNDYSSATDYDIVPNDSLNNDVKSVKKSGRTAARKRPFSDENSSHKESLVKARLCRSNDFFSKSRKTFKGINDNLSLLSDYDDEMGSKQTKKDNITLTNKVYSLQSKKRVKNNHELCLVENFQVEGQNNHVFGEESSYKNNDKMTINTCTENRKSTEFVDENSECKSKIVTQYENCSSNYDCKMFCSRVESNNLSRVDAFENDSLCGSETNVLKLPMVEETVKDIDKKYLPSKDFTVVENEMKTEKDFKSCIYNNSVEEMCKNLGDIHVVTDDKLLVHVNADDAIDPLNIYKKNNVSDKNVNFNNLSDNFYNILNAYGLLPVTKTDNVKDFFTVDLNKHLINIDLMGQFSELSGLNENDYDSQMSVSDTECNNDIYNKYFYMSKWRKSLPEHHRKTLNLLTDIVQIIINKLVIYEFDINEYMLNFKDDINKIIEVLNTVRHDKKLNIENNFFFRNSCNKRLANHLNRIEKQESILEKIKSNMKKGYLAQKNMIDNFHHNVLGIY
ncbi:hypothetical protein PORY_001467 [Pneumocystis oryctolagi]|uniref:Uncharacterized protein n=1 Tax=Pneumocystis oryctolagi TaxID=42067 RepID=A0ACB7CC26_9ASCO|nr:hypothetical protein PORY_001467 [Pneumocystis oryctolagi]